MRNLSALLSIIVIASAASAAGPGTNLGFETANEGVAGKRLRLFGKNDATMVLQDQYDGVMLIDTNWLPEYLPDPESESP